MKYYLKIFKFNVKPCTFDFMGDVDLHCKEASTYLWGTKKVQWEKQKEFLVSVRLILEYLYWSCVLLEKNGGKIGRGTAKNHKAWENTKQCEAAEVQCVLAI